MLKLIVGLKGTGKTKMLIDMVNNAVDTTSGSVVCIEKGNKLKFDVKYQARLIDTSDYDVNNADSLYGMVCGLYAENYDITHIFIDSALKICNGDLEGFEKFILMAEKISTKNNFDLIITSSVESEKLSENIKKYL